MSLNRSRRPGIAVGNKQERRRTVVDIAVSGDNRIHEKQNKNVEKY